VIPNLSLKIANAAPGVALHVRLIGDWDILDQLDAGGADIALTRLVDGGERFKCVQVTDDDYVALLDRQHPAATLGAFTPEHLARIPHVIITSGDDDTSFVDDALSDIGLSRKMVNRVPLLSIVLMLVGSARLAILPRRPANGLASVCPLVVKELPFASPRTELFMIWHRGLDNVPAQRWLRGMIRASVQG
jgi:DNA-binding transcriptional LysR family regulator